MGKADNYAMSNPSLSVGPDDNGGNPTLTAGLSVGASGKSRMAAAADQKGRA
jgi:hypothetical protein